MSLELEKNHENRTNSKIYLVKATDFHKIRQK